MRNFILLLLCLYTMKKLEAQSSTVAGKPNIILILADDLGFGDIGEYGQSKIKTPHLDWLAKSGLRFNQFYSGSTVCAPARVSLMTGMHTGHTPVRGNKSFEPEGQFPLPDSSQTIAMELRKAGYTTGAFGKWSMGYVSSSGAPSQKGFDYFFGYNCQSLAHDYYPDHLWENEKRIELTENREAAHTYSGDLIHQKAIQFINRQDDKKPFFLYLPYTLPHADLTVPQDSLYFSYVKQFNEKPQPQSDPRNKNKFVEELYPHAAYAAMVSRLDKYVGDVVSVLAKKNMLENTIILFTSDNGPHRERGGDPEFFNSNGMYRGIKRDLYEGGIRMPLIISWKGHIEAGRQSEHIAAGWDIFPTLQQLAGIHVSQKMDGISFVPTLFNKPQPVHEYLYWEFHEMGGRQAVRWKNWKAVRLQVSTDKPSATELYNLEEDPAEQNNQATQQKELVKKMEAFMRDAHKLNKDWPLFVSEK